MNEFNEEEMQEVQTENKQPKQKEEIVCKSAKTLRTVGFIILILGILFSIIGVNDRSAIILVIILPSLAVWAFAMAFATITEDIHIMAHKKTEA